MANRKTHLTAGITCGVAAAIYSARDQAGCAFIGEVIGGGVGGAAGGLLPDLFEGAHFLRLFFTARAGQGARRQQGAQERSGRCSEGSSRGSVGS